MPALLVLLLVVVLAVFTDLRWRRIHDWITFPGIVLGIVLNGLDSGWWNGVWTAGAQGSLVAALVGWGVLAVLVVLGGMGGGDAKLMGAVGALAGPQALPAILILTSMAGGLLGVGALLLRRPRGRALAARLGMSGTRDPDFARGVPYAVAIGAGVLGWLAVASGWVWVD